MSERTSLTVIDAEIEEATQEAQPELVLGEEKKRHGPGHWLAQKIKKVMPRRLLARSILIIVTPVVITQCVITYIFFEAHWNTVTRRLSESVAGDIALVIKTYETFPDVEKLEDLKQITLETTKLSIAVHENEEIPVSVKSSFFSALDRTLRTELAKQIDRPFWFDTTRYPQFVDIRIQFDDDVLRVVAQRERVFATSGPIFLIWMFGTSLLLLTVAIIFLRNQVRPIQQLADAAESFGKGGEIKEFKPYGATEVRRASESFIEMRDRIMRQIEQRTLLLAGVSHDLRTPITRMKLQAALMEPSEDLDALRQDIDEMEHMLEEYLAFARGQGSEAAVNIDMAALLREICEGAKRAGFDIALDIRGDLHHTVRRNAMKRCLGNLVNNAMQHGTKVAIIGTRTNSYIEIAVDDNGPGIPEDKVEEAFKPFKRLDEARNLDAGGVGLGLAIAQDVAHGHGGDIKLLRSPWNGLRALIRLPL